MNDYAPPFHSPDSAWCVAVFASRETPKVLKSTLMAVQAAIQKPATIDVLVNGNRELAESAKTIIAALTETRSLAKFRLWFIALGDKAHTWNVYLHALWPGDGLAYFIDGYTRPCANSLTLIEQALCANTVALGASGVPTVGHSAGKLRAAQIADRGIHGNLFCLCADTMLRLRAAGFRLPLGLYRTDPLIGAVLKYTLDPRQNTWNPERILVKQEATWLTDKKKWWSYAEIKSQFKRRIRQAQGDLENQAVRHHLSICRRPPQDMPVTIAALIETWLNETPLEAAALLKNPLRQHALNQLRRPRDWSLAEAPPELMEIAASI